MANGLFVAYYRVSTEDQGRSGLGLEAQRASVHRFLNGGDWSLAGEFTEVESGGKSDRPMLREAMRACRVHRATLVISKLDRLSRDAHFLFGLEKAGVDFIAVDNPHANRLTIGIMAVIADEERRVISERTKAALAAAKARGRQLGGYRGTVIAAETREKALIAKNAAVRGRAADLAPVIEELMSSGLSSLREIAAGLNARGVPTATGRGVWQATQVRRLMDAMTRK
jgi:DNA invertase Pin-like site-specific DNA recombinase